MSGGMKFLMERPKLFNTALKFAPVVNNMPRFMIYNALNHGGKGAVNCHAFSQAVVQ